MRAGPLPIAAAAFLLAVAGTARAEEAPDRRYLALPPAYPAPPAGFFPLPAAGVPSVPRDPATPADRPTWTPARTEVVIGLDARGRITSVLEHTPGRFGR